MFMEQRATVWLEPGCRNDRTEVLYKPLCFEESALTQIWRPSDGANYQHNTGTSGPGHSFQYRIESEAENVYIRITIQLKRLILEATNAIRLMMHQGLDCGTSTAG